MRILMVSRRYPPDVLSGSETVFANLYRLAREDHEVKLVAGYVRSRSLIPDEALGVDLRDRGIGWRHLAMWRAVRHEARRFKPDVVLSNNIEVPSRWASRAVTACIVHDLNFGELGHTWQHSLHESYYRWKCRRLDRVITVSEVVRRELMDIGVDARRIDTIHNGVDLESFRPLPHEPRERIQLVYPGRIAPGKGHHIAIDAVARLAPPDKQRVELHIVGAVGQERDRVYFDQLKVMARGQPVFFHPDVADIVPWYTRADLVLFPTLLREGFGYTAVEAMAAGRPVVWAEHPAIRESTGGIGRAVPPGDVAALRAVIREFLAHPGPFADMGRDGRTFVEAHYDWDVVWGRYLDLLTQAREERR